VSALTDGRGLFLLHGAGGRGLVWQHQALAFPQAKTPDLPGRDGRPPEGVDGYLAALRGDLAMRGPALRGGLPAQRVLAGHSLGASIALRWALKHPDEVRGLILIGAGARTRVNPVWLEGVARGDTAAVEEFGSWWFGPDSAARLREKSLALLRATPAEVLLADLRAADAFDVTAQLDQIRIPALILCGADDRLTPVKYARYLHERIAGSTLEVIDGAGHMVMLERPQAANAVIRRFLGALEQGADRGADWTAPGGTST
jgi:pimeloyl-ACP methyl ester carboxylesterase